MNKNDWAKGILAEFDKQAKPIGMKMFIDYKGLKVDFDEYMQVRLNEDQPQAAEVYKKIHD